MQTCVLALLATAAATGCAPGSGAAPISAAAHEPHKHGVGSFLRSLWSRAAVETAPPRCVLCAVGRASSGGSGEPCAKCVAGRFSLASVRCVACPVGKHQPAAGHTFCVAETATQAAALAPTSPTRATLWSC